MGLRDRKKKTTRESILNGARQLFMSDGYRETSMEKIAEASDVAVGTIYNYFDSKADVMIAINMQDTEGSIADLDEVDLDEMAVEDIIWKVLEVFLGTLSNYPRNLLRELIAISFESTHSKLTNGLISQDERFLGYLTGLLSRLKESGRIKQETDPEAVAFAIYSMAFGGVMWFAIDQRISPEKAKILVAGMIGQLCRGILPGRK